MILEANAPHEAAPPKLAVVGRILTDKTQAASRLRSLIEENIFIQSTLQSLRRGQAINSRYQKASMKHIQNRFLISSRLLYEGVSMPIWWLELGISHQIGPEAVAAAG